MKSNKETTKREIESFWWAPEQPETRWFGTLTLEQNTTPSLELIVERSDPVLDQRQLGPVIHGKDEHGQPITLLFTISCGEVSRGAVIKRTFSAGYALLGIALPNADTFVANSLRFQVQQLYGWLGRTGFERSETERFGMFSVRYKQPEDEWISITPDLDLGVHGTFESTGTFQEKGICEDAALTFRSKAGHSLAHCNKLVGSVRLLLHLASLKQVYPVWMTAYTHGHGYQVGDQWEDQDIEIHSSTLRDAKSELPIADYWVFRREDVDADFAGFIRRWLKYTDDYAEPLGCYSSTIYHPLTAELAHLSLTQALEAYHGIRFASHHKHEFQAKIKELADLHTRALGGLLPDVGDFSERVLCTRNHYTHHNPKWIATGKVAERAELVRMNEKLKLLFQMLVLSDLGIPAERFTRLRRQLATEIIEYM